MTFPSQGQIDVIATQILLDAKQALLSLQAWNNSLVDAQAKTKFLKELIKATAQQMSGDFKAASAAVGKFAKALNINPQLIQKVGKDLAALDKIAQKSLGGMAQQSLSANVRITALANGIAAMATRSKASIDSVVSSLRTLNASTGSRFGKLGFSDQDLVKAGAAAQGVSKDIQKVGTASTKTGKEATDAFGRVFTAVNALRIALGAIISMLLFGFIQAVGNALRGTIENLRETELAVYNLINAERRLSEEGIEISPKGLQEIIDSVQELVPILSKIDAEELVARVASNVAPSLKLTREEIEKLTKAVALAYVQNKALGYSFDEIEKSFTDSVLTGKVSQGLNKYGVKITDIIVKQHAVSMGLIENVDAFDKLSGEMQAHVQAVSLIDYAYEKFSENTQSIPEYMKTTDAALEVSKKSWSDLLTTIGQLAAPFIVEFLNVLIDQLVLMNEWLVKNEGTIKQTVATMAGMFAGMVKLSEISERGFFEKLDAAGNFKEFIQAVKDGMDRAKESAAELNSALDTPTGNPKIVPEVDNEDALKALEDLEDKIQDIILDAKQAQEDLDIKLGQKQEDLDLEYIRKGEDAAENHADKLEDINQDALDKIEDAKRKAREEEKNKEQDLLQKLKELRERFLLDLEDALHARDARAVLRLIKEYKLEKQNILDRAKLEEQQRKESLAADLAQIEIERQRRIESEQIEYQRKLADLALAKSREQDELQTWYKREQEDIQRNIEQKLEKLLQGYISEETLHKEHQKAIYDILSYYFGKDMELMGNLTQFMAAQFAQVSALANAIAQVGSLNYGLGNSGQTNPFSGGLKMPVIPYTYTASSPTKFAEGGSMIATRPTTAMFGERGPELATFIPLGRNGANVGKMFGDGGGGMGGQLTVSVLLSPDLEGRIVEKSMDGVGEMVAKINNTKVR